MSGRANAPVARTPTRARLLAATMELLAEDGYAAASVGAITERTGVAAGTLYRHFPSKEALFVELFREVCNGEVEAMHAAAATHDAPLDQLAAALETFARRALVHPRVAWALLAEPVDALVDAERLDYRRRYRALVAELLDAAIAAGSIPPADSDLLAAAIVGGVGEALVGPLSTGAGSATDTEHLVAEIRRFALNAAGCRPTDSAGD